MKSNKKDSPAKESERIEMAKEVQKTIDLLNSRNLIETGMLSDGDHTFEELYFHRMVLFSIICNANTKISWKSQLHSDDTMFPNYFIVGITTPEGDFSYHYHMEYWNHFNVKILSNAPPWDGHESEDIGRLRSLLWEVDIDLLKMLKYTNEKENVNEKIIRND